MIDCKSAFNLSSSFYLFRSAILIPYLGADRCSLLSLSFSSRSFYIFNSPAGSRLVNLKPYELLKYVTGSNFSRSIWAYSSIFLYFSFSNSSSLWFISSLALYLYFSSALAAWFRNFSWYGTDMLSFVGNYGAMYDFGFRFSVKSKLSLSLLMKLLRPLKTSWSSIFVWSDY